MFKSMLLLHTLHLCNGRKDKKFHNLPSKWFLHTKSTFGHSQLQVRILQHPMVLHLAAMHFGPKQLFRTLQKNILRHFATLESSQRHFLQLLLTPNGKNKFVKFFQVQNAVKRPAILMYNMPESHQQDLRSPIHPCRPVVRCTLRRNVACVTCP